MSQNETTAPVVVEAENGDNGASPSSSKPRRKNRKSNRDHTKQTEDTSPDFIGPERDNSIRASLKKQKPRSKAKKGNKSSQITTTLADELPDDVVDSVGNNSIKIIVNKQKPKRKSKKGNSDLRNPAKQPGENKLFCDYCDVFLTEQFHEVHQRMKKHKRNVRKWRKLNEGDSDEKADQTPFAVQAIPLPEQLPEEVVIVPNSVFNRKKYESCFDTTNKDKDYLLLLTALFCVKLALDEDIEDFYISVFNKKWLSFGDVVIEIVKRDLSQINYAIKCKNVSNGQSELKSFKELINADKEIKRVMDLAKNKNFDQMTFAIFTSQLPPRKTNSNFEYSSEEENPKLPFGEKILPIRDKARQLIDVSGENKTIFEIRSLSSPKILLFTNQYVTSDRIDQQILKIFDDRSDIGSVSKEFARYIRHWSKGKLGGNYSLRKIDTVLKIAELLLPDVIVEPVILSKNAGNNLESYKIWNDIIDEVDLTVMKNEPYNISRISDPLNKILDNTFATTIRSNRLLNLPENLVQALEPEIKAYLFEEVDNLKDPLAPSKLYHILWKADRIPLIVNDKEKWRDLVLNIISFLKRYGFKRKFIMLSDDPPSVTTKNELKTFRCLRDINVDLSRISIKVSNGPDISLEVICRSNPFLLKWVTPDIFFNLSLQKCSFKGVAHKYFRDRGDILQIIINDDALLRNIYQGMFQGQIPGDNHIIFSNLKGLDPELLSTNVM